VILPTVIRSTTNSLQWLGDLYAEVIHPLAARQS
jgi:hypothetical protein